MRVREAIHINPPNRIVINGNGYLIFEVVLPVTGITRRGSEAEAMAVAVGGFVGERSFTGVAP